MFKYPIAVTIDTNIFDSAKYDLSENSTLQLLKKYVNDGKIKVVLSDIVVRESKKHLAKQANKVCGIARKLRAEVLRESTEHFVNYIGLDRLLEIDKDKSVFMKNQRIIAGNAQFTGIAAGRGVGFTTGLLLLREGLGMR